MQKWLFSIVLGVVFGSVAVLAQGQPPRDERRPQMPQPPPQQMMQQQMMHHQAAMQRMHQMQASQPRCPLGHHAKPALALLLLGATVIHILLTVWVYGDLRRRNSGSGIWIAMVLLTGLCGAAVYALVRIGEKPA
ncbi:MAG: hypothetical protein NTY53_21830 [Kiritimatiellaeota bacterium]|nr:hypothetical protein [Kiritimatiellota bacterium]